MLYVSSSFTYFSDSFPFKYETCIWAWAWPNCKLATSNELNLIMRINNNKLQYPYGNKTNSLANHLTKASWILSWDIYFLSHMSVFWRCFCLLVAHSLAHSLSCKYISIFAWNTYTMTFRKLLCNNLVIDLARMHLHEKSNSWTSF